MSGYLPPGCTQEMCDVGVIENDDICGSCGHRYDIHAERCKVDDCECERFNSDEPYEIDDDMERER